MSAPICRSCSHALRQRQIWIRALPLSFRQEHGLRQVFNVQKPKTHHILREQRRLASRVASKEVEKAETNAQASATTQHKPINDEAILSDFTQQVDGILQSDKVPSEEDCLRVLRKHKAAAMQALAAADLQASFDDPASNAEAVLKAMKANHDLSRIIDRVTRLAFQFLCHPPVFITASMLDIYVRTQCLLQDPYPLPEVFDLYAHKPAPIPNSNPIRYRKQNPNKVSVAIPVPLANMAVDAAIRRKDMQLSLDIITTSFRTIASRRSRILRRASPLIIGLGLSPLGAYTIASKFASYQITVEHEAATAATFACIMAYVVTTSSLGLIAIATANDQMERVTWQDGTPLRHRWLREDERAAVDRIALGFGYKDKLRRGEETGKDWEMLKEWAGMRSMIVDRVSLMEGME